MADDEEYDEVEAVVRMPKGARLASSRKTEGWNRGFTPKSADKGPEHIEIRLKGEVGSESVQEQEAYHVTECMEAPRPHERSMAEQAAAVFLSRVIDELIEAAKPHVAHWWNTHVIPATRAKRDDFLLRRRQARKAKTAGRASATTTTFIAELAAEDGASTERVATVPSDPKITMTSKQFRQLFMTWLGQEDAQRTLWYAIANAHIDDSDRGALAWRQGLNELSPRQRTERVREIISANPSILEDLGRHLTGSVPLELGETIARRDET